VKEIEFQVPRDCDLKRAGDAIEKVCAARGLEIGKKGTQASFPGSTHWHFKKPGEKGTLEFTVFVPERRVWAQVQDGRKAAWIDAELPLIQREIERALRALRALR